MVFSSCDFLNLNDPNTVTTEKYYQNEADIESLLNGVYGSLTQAYVINHHYMFTDVRANITVYHKTGVNSGIPYQLYNYTITEENTYVYNRYGQLFFVVARANNLLAHLDDVTYELSTTRDTFEAEARFIRAWAYFALVTEFGDLPLVLAPLNDREEVNAANFRRPTAEIYSVIYDDLKYVTESPLSDSQTVCGKASKTAAWALWGKALLQQARSKDFEAADKKTEADALIADAIVKLNTAWGLKSFGELTEINYDDIFNLATQKDCPENIFQVNYIQGNPDLGSIWCSEFAPNKSDYSQLEGQMNNVTTKAVYDTFEGDDIRKEYLFPWTTSGVTWYYTTKYLDLDCTVSGAGGNNWILLRHADVALMLAEAYYWSGDEGNAQTWLNKVRTRAGLANYTKTGLELRNAIYEERTHELIHEGHGWLDALRKFTDAEMVEYYHAKNENFAIEDLLLPIPYRERILNPEGLYQNPGYGK